MAGKCQKSNLSFTREEIIWLAGLLEGEGSFQILSQPQYRIELGMTDKDVVERAQKIMGGTMRVREQNQSEKWNTVYMLQNSRRLEVHEILCAILPFMGQRRQQRIQQLIEGIDHG